MVSYGISRNQANSGATDSYRQQSDLIVQCARKCFEAKGMRKTTLVDVAREAGITRELIYYYFSGKPEILNYILDSYVQDAVESTRLWCDIWAGKLTPGEDCLPRAAVVDAIASVRRFVFKANGEQRPMFQVLDETGKRYEISSRMCDSILQELGSHAIVEQVRASFSRIQHDQTAVAFKLIMLGIVSLMECDGTQDDAKIADILMSFTNGQGV